MGSAASTAYTLGQETAGSSSVGAGLGGIARAAGNTARTRMSQAFGLSEAASSGRAAAHNAFNQPGGGSSPTDSTPPSDGAPAWARAMRREQTARHHRHVALQAIKDGDRGGGSATPDIKERDE